MAINREDCFKATLGMVQVTPDNYKKLDANMILYLCKVVAEAEKLNAEPSAYDNLTKEQIMERM